jgi:hypothetical protein
MRTVRPFWELSIFRRSAGFSPQWLHAGIGFGSKLENTSFLNSLIKSPPVVERGTKLQSGLSFRKVMPPLLFSMELFDNLKSKQVTGVPN